MPRATIAGLGLIGGSIGIALRASGWRVAYVDPHVELDEAIAAGAADERVDDLDDGDLVVIATPLDVARAIVNAIDASMRVTSVCSVMQPLRDIANSRALRFTAGHPLAGSEERSLAAADGNLFRGKRWFVDRDDAFVTRMIADCGAIVDRVEDAGAHDAALALTSHLPQLLSTALAAYLDATGVDVNRFGGSGLRTFLRLAGSEGSVWTPVFEANRTNLGVSAADVARVAQSLIDGDSEAFERARRVWSRISSAPQ
ncbi:MAG TPA: prephenate dehydrogenase/arogenate dehydrogenase family protein [Thermoanaerobaculia bacterium]|nr:prephenate dehydrogenase/arogenate dehydrogenase family protein [Thermoanaerobaculia bacterium]